MLAINQLIKIILGIFVVISVALSLYFFGNYITDFFGNLPGGNSSKFTLVLLK